MDFRAEHKQTQTLSPRLQRAVRLLQMSSLDFAALVRNKLDENPFLEDDGEGEGDDGAVPDSGPAERDDAAAEREVERETERETEREIERDAELPRADDFAERDEFGAERDDADSRREDAVDDRDFDRSDDRDLWQADGGGGMRRGEDGEISALDMMAVESSLADHLHGQLNVLPLPQRDLTLARVIVESLDDDGYLRTPLPELAELMVFDPPATLPEMQIALKRVQSLDPAGVAARNVAECLLLQLAAIDCPEQRGLAQIILTEHMPALAARDVSGLARKLGEQPALIEAVCDRIRRLDPRPGWRFGSQQVPYIIPDVLVKKVRGQWTVNLNPAVVPRVRFNQVYAELFQRHRTAQNTELAGHLQEARWTLRNVELRFSTIVEVAAAIVRRQKHFLEYGAMAMKPLGLREIAEELGIHESTVSRVTNNKYMSTPLGVFELKHFFSRAMVTANGGACSGTAIRGLIKDIIEAESTAAPLSDAEITRQLAQQGLVVARRTVTKYRQMLHIEAVDRRRRVA